MKRKRTISIQPSLMVSLLVIVLSLFTVIGCSEIPSNITQTQAVAQKPVTVFGKVIDAETRQGVSGATVYLKYGSDWKSETTASDDLKAGDFSFTDVPANATLPLVIKGPSSASYVQINTTISTPARTNTNSDDDEVNSAISKDLGKFTMSKGVELTLYVKDRNTGENVEMSDDSAIPIYWLMSGGSVTGGGASLLDVFAEQDSTDTNKYTIVVHPSNSTIITVPNLDNDGDGTFDYLATSITVNPLVDGSSLTRTVMLTPVVTDGVTVTLYIIDSTTGNYVSRTDSSGNPVPIPITAFSGGNQLGIIATQDTTNTNKYTVVIPQNATTTLTVPNLDTDGNNVFDYLTASININPTNTDVPLTRNIVLNPVSTDQVVVNVYVVDSTTGNYVTRTDSSGNPLSIPIYSDILGTLQHTAVKDTTDTNKYTISLSQNNTNWLTVPAFDSNGDGILDYQTASILVDLDGDGSDLDAIVSGKVNRNIVVTPITDTTTLAIEENNFRRTVGAGVGNVVNAVGKSDNIKLLFNVPVSLATTGDHDITLTYTDDFKSLSAAAVEAEQAVSVSLSAGNTLVTIDPTLDLTENQVYELRGTVVQASNDYVYDLQADLNVDGGLGNIYVYAAGTGTIGSTPAVTVDNGNYWTKNSSGVDAVITTGDPIALAVGTPQLLFPEAVWGDIRLVSSPVLNSAVQTRALTGALSFANASTSVSGTGTAFTSEVKPGDTLRAPNGANYTIATVPGDTSLTLTAAYGGSTSPTGGETAWIVNRGGTISCTTDNTQITGTNTLFTKDLSGGDIITFNPLTINTTKTFYKITAIDNVSITVDPAIKAGDEATCDAAGVAGIRKVGTQYYNNDNSTVVPTITYLIKASSVDPLTAFNTKGYNTAGAVHMVNLNTAFGIGNLTDSTTNAPLNLTIGIDVVDVEGNTYQTESSFEIK